MLSSVREERSGREQFEEASGRLFVNHHSFCVLLNSNPKTLHWKVPDSVDQVGRLRGNKIVKFDAVYGVGQVLLQLRDSKGGVLRPLVDGISEPFNFIRE